MKIGITYDLKDDYIAEGFSKEEAAEFDTIDTIDGIENALNKLHFQTERIGNAKSLLKKIHNGQRWDLVFNICEGVHGIGREAQVPAILDVFNIPYVFSDVLVLSLTLHKGLTKRVIHDLNIPTAEFDIVESEKDIDRINLPYPLFAKPVAEGSGKGIDAKSKVNNFSELKTTCTDLLNRFKQPVLIETFLPGREFTVGIVGTGEESKCIGLMEVLFKADAEKNAYSYFNKTNYEKVIEYIVPEKEIADKCYNVALQAWKALGCRDGGRIDLRLDEKGIPNFIEVNPLAGLNPTYSDLPILSRFFNIDYVELIGEIMKSAIKRISKK